MLNSLIIYFHILYTSGRVSGSKHKVRQLIISNVRVCTLYTMWPMLVRLWGIYGVAYVSTVVRYIRCGVFLHYQHVVSSAT